jgi:hypothetical protein
VIARFGRDGVVERAVDRAQHLAVGQLRQPAVDGIVEPQLRLLDQDHRGRCGDRFCERGDAEDGVAAHRIAVAGRLQADRIDMSLAAPAHERDQARHLAARDMAEHAVAHARKPRRRQSSAAHRSFPPAHHVAV